MQAFLNQYTSPFKKLQQEHVPTLINNNNDTLKKQMNYKQQIVNANKKVGGNMSDKIASYQNGFIQKQPQKNSQDTQNVYSQNTLEQQNQNSMAHTTTQKQQQKKQNKKNIIQPVQGVSELTTINPQNPYNPFQNGNVVENNKNKKSQKMMRLDTEKSHKEQNGKNFRMQPSCEQEDEVLEKSFMDKEEQEEEEDVESEDNFEPFEKNQNVENQKNNQMDIEIDQQKIKTQKVEQPTSVFSNKQKTDLTGPKKSTQKYLVKRDHGKFVSTKPIELQKKKIEKVWLPSYSIISVTYPARIDQQIKTKRKWVIDFVYVDSTNHKKHQKKVRFGRNGVDDFIDHHDFQKKEKFLNNLRNAQNPFKANFWTLQLLNNSDSLEDNYMCILKQL